MVRASKTTVSAVALLRRAVPSPIWGIVVPSCSVWCRWVTPMRSQWSVVKGVLSKKLLVFWGMGSLSWVMVFPGVGCGCSLSLLCLCGVRLWNFWGDTAVW